MMDPNPDNRFSAEEIFNNHLQSELELEMKWEKLLIKELQEKIKEYERVLKIKRKKSFWEIEIQGERRLQLISLTTREKIITTIPVLNTFTFLLETISCI